MPYQILHDASVRGPNFMKSPSNGVGVETPVIMGRTCALTEKVKRGGSIPQCSSGKGGGRETATHGISFVIDRYFERHSLAYMNSRKGREKPEQIHYPENDNNDNKSIQDGFDV
jgi:hypothetical protein